MRHLCMMLLVTCICAPALAQSSGEKELVAAEQHWLASLQNPDALESILADDFVHVLPQGLVTKSEQIEFLRTHPAAEHVKRKFGEIRVRVFGNVGVVNGTVFATDARGAIRKTFFTDVFQKRHGRWQAVNAQETPAADARSH